MEPNQPVLNSISRARTISLVVGALGIAALTIGALSVGTIQFSQSYLLGYVLWITLALGCLGLTLLHNVMRGSWALPILRFLESGVYTLPIMALLFIPIAIALPNIYLWARPEVIQNDAILKFKAPYLNETFFLIRTVVYFAIWIALGFPLVKWSLQQDETKDPALAAKRTTLAAPGLVVFVLTASFASFDWVMSLEPHWFSTIFGIIFVIGQVLTTTAFGAMMLLWLSNHSPLKEVTQIEHYHDIGKLLFAFTMFWAYIWLSQLLIIWSANLPEEVTYYLSRFLGGWQYIAWVLLLGQFFLPFLALMSARTKQSPKYLVIIVAFILFMRIFEMIWLIVPSFHPHHFVIHWMDIAAILGIGGIWMGMFFWRLAKVPLVITYDPRLSKEAAENV